MELAAAPARINPRERSHPAPRLRSEQGASKAPGPVPVPSFPVRRGNLVLREDVTLPEGLALVTRPFRRGWNLVRQPRPAELEGALGRHGWYLFAWAGEVRAWALGRRWEAALDRAFDKLCAKASARGLNAIEVTGVRMRNFAGFRWVRIRATLRHIQEGPYLLKTSKQVEWRLRRVRHKARHIRRDRRRRLASYRTARRV